MWFTLLTGVGTINGLAWAKGDCWLLEGDCAITVTDTASILLATLH